MGLFYVHLNLTFILGCKFGVVNLSLILGGKREVAAEEVARDAGFPGVSTGSH